MEEKTQAQKEKSPKRKHVGLIVFACAVLLAIILAVCLTGTPRHAITLPTGSADVSAGKEQAGYQLKDTNITVRCVQRTAGYCKHEPAEFVQCIRDQHAVLERKLAKN